MAVTVTVPPSTTKLIALADLKAILGITDSANDALLGQIIQRGSDAVARFCHRVFARRTVIETLPGPGGQLLKLKCPQSSPSPPSPSTAKRSTRTATS